MKSKKGIVFTIIGVVVVLVLTVVLTIVFWPKKDKKEVYTDAIKNAFNVGKITEKVSAKVSASAIQSNETIGKS